MPVTSITESNQFVRCFLRVKVSSVLNSHHDAAVKNQRWRILVLDILYDRLRCLEYGDLYDFVNLVSLIGAV
ncbi:unnamed protein product [Acanthoscelides obtectus]|uniref:Uncharacterized protein n=1 Tax=Acanthoscelides obtectus TaxID=200917 RepID=A0A9P0K0M1_ACAOB|nr:unnamed protein product [Acanthoscelides obtectus]CAK1638099.1 hypothetical protein AOBTE_LOCUS10387 [Acanthoscelides obtectus]